AIQAAAGTACALPTMLPEQTRAYNGCSCYCGGDGRYGGGNGTHCRWCGNVGCGTVSPRLGDSGSTVLPPSGCEGVRLCIAQHWSADRVGADLRSADQWAARRSPRFLGYPPPPLPGGTHFDSKYL